MENACARLLQGVVAQALLYLQTKARLCFLSDWIFYRPVRRLFLAIREAQVVTPDAEKGISPIDGTIFSGPRNE